MKKNIVLFLVLFGCMFSLTACKKTKASKKKKKTTANRKAKKTNQQPSTPKGTSKVVLASEVKWEQLNPARGDKSPQAADLWGGRKQTGETGFLVKFVDGFSSPPHIHNVSYRGVVIRGLVHNDDPKAANMWMPVGSYWTQPKGEVHITSAKGKVNIAFIEIEKGPYLVLPTKKAFDSGERPINQDPSNIVWLHASSVTWLSQKQDKHIANKAKIAFLWGNTNKGQRNGSFLKLPAGFSGTLRNNGSTLRAVVIQGQYEYRSQGASQSKTLDPGSYFSSKGKMNHQLSCKAKKDCILYIRMQGRYNFIPSAKK